MENRKNSEGGQGSQGGKGNSTQERPSVNFTRHYKASPEKVWRAWTDPQALVRWFGPESEDVVSVADLDVRVGGRYHIRFGVPGGEVHDVSGVYQEVVPSEKLVFSWAWKSTPERVSQVTVMLRPWDGGTQLTFMHEKFYDQAARDSHNQGWTGAFAKLDLLFT